MNVRSLKPVAKVVHITVAAWVAVLVAAGTP